MKKKYNKMKINEINKINFNKIINKLFIYYI